MLGFTTCQLKIQYLLRVAFALVLGIGLSFILGRLIGTTLLNRLVSLGGLTQFSVALPFSVHFGIILLLFCESSLLVFLISQRITKFKIGDFL
jgi:putative ABC transport system permease protein